MNLPRESNGKIGFRKLAKELGISPMTVSRAFNKPELVAPQTRELIYKAARSQGMRSFSQIGSKGILQRTLCVLCSEEIYEKSRTEPTFDSEVWRHSILEGQRKNLTTLVVSVGRKVNDIPQYQLLAENPDIGGFIATDSEATQGALDYLRDKNLPVVLLGIAKSPYENFYCVANDDFHGGYTVTKHLLEKGFEKILFLSFLGFSSVARLRLAGYRKAFLEAGREVDPEKIVHLMRGDEISSGYDSVKLMLNRKVPFDSVFCTSDLRAIGAINALEEHGIRVPEDVPVVGYDDLPNAASFRIPLTSFNQNLPELVRYSVEVIDRFLASNRSLNPHSHVIQGNLVVRSSA